MGQKEKQARGKFLAKHETEENWNKSNYVPDKGEHVIYDPDEKNLYPRVKYGDGQNIVKDLPFAYATKEIEGQASGALNISITDASPVEHDMKVSLLTEVGALVRKGDYWDSENGHWYDVPSGTYKISAVGNPYFSESSQWWMTAISFEDDSIPGYTIYEYAEYDDETEDYIQGDPPVYDIQPGDYFVWDLDNDSMFLMAELTTPKVVIKNSELGQYTGTDVYHTEDVSIGFHKIVRIVTDSESYSGTIYFEDGSSFHCDWPPSQSEIGSWLYYDGYDEEQQMPLFYDCRFVDPSEVEVKVYGEDSSNYKVYVPDANGIAIIESIYPVTNINANTFLEVSYLKNVNEALGIMPNDDPDFALVVGSQIRALAKKLAKTDVANALKGSASGNPIRIDDISPLEHTMKVKLSRDPSIGESFCDTSVPNDITTDLTSTGYYTVASVEDVEDCATITFTNGAYVSSSTMLSDLEWELSKGDVVYYDADEKLLYYTTTSSVTGAVLKKYGKNIFNVDANYRNEKGINVFYKQEDGRYWFGYVGDFRSSNYDKGCYIPANTPFTVSIKNVKFSSDDFDISSVAMRLFYNGSGMQYSFSKSNKQGDTYYLKLTIGAPITQVSFMFDKSLGDGHSITFESAQIELGSIATEHEEYRPIEQYTADENGVVEGIIGNGEEMTLFADDGITIHAEYNKDINKATADIPTIKVDTALSTTSENPVQNKVVTKALNAKMDKDPSQIIVYDDNGGYVKMSFNTYDPTYENPEENLASFEIYDENTLNTTILNRSGITLYENEGTYVYSKTWEELLGDKTLSYKSLASNATIHSNHGGDDYFGAGLANKDYKISRVVSTGYYYDEYNTLWTDDYQPAIGYGYLAYYDEGNPDDYVEYAIFFFSDPPQAGDYISHDDDGNVFLYSSALLPDITTIADNDKVLQVVNGKWKKANIPDKTTQKENLDTSKVYGGWGVDDGDWCVQVPFSSTYRITGIAVDGINDTGIYYSWKVDSLSHYGPLEQDDDVRVALYVLEEVNGIIPEDYAGEDGWYATDWGLAVNYDYHQTNGLKVGDVITIVCNSNHDLFTSYKEVSTQTSLLLPTVTEADNGKTIQVVNGKWEKILNPSSGGGLTASTDSIAINGITWHRTKWSNGKYECRCTVKPSETASSFTVTFPDAVTNPHVTYSVMNGSLSFNTTCTTTSTTFKMSYDVGAIKEINLLILGTVKN